MKTFFRSIDWLLVLALVPILGAGLLTMNSFSGHSSIFTHQAVWIAVSFTLFFFLSWMDTSFLKRTSVLISLFIFGCLVLVALFFVGHVAKGAQSWFRLGLFSIQPSDPIKIILILVLAKYFSRRHIEIKNLRHILVSGAYAFIVFTLIIIQPDFGSAIIIFFIWLGMVLVSGISRRHIFAVAGICLVTFGLLWSYGLKDYQKQRVKTFLNPLADVRGAGYNAYQSTIAVGSGQILGKGIGYGTQSKLNFLPEYQTDFIFAAFAEEWGFVGALILFALYVVVMWRVLAVAYNSNSNFVMLYAIGICVLFMTNFIINIGMNIGLLPVTGVTVPFMSYGGSHLVTELSALGVLMSMRHGSQPARKDMMQNEFLGI